MIIVERAPLNQEDQALRAEVLELLAGVHLIYEVESLDGFAEWLDDRLAELESAGFAPLLRRVILIGELGGPVCQMITDHLMPGLSCRVLPQPTAWREVWKRRGDIALALGSST